MPKPILQRLEDFATLAKGWNGYEAMPIPEKAIDRAKDGLSSPPFINIELEVFPTARKSIQAELEHDCGSYFELEFFASKTSLLYQKVDGSEIDIDDVDQEAIEKYFGDFCTRLV